MNYKYYHRWQHIYTRIHSFCLRKRGIWLPYIVIQKKSFVLDLRGNCLLLNVSTAESAKNIFEKKKFFSVTNFEFHVENMYVLHTVFSWCYSIKIRKNYDIT